AEAELAEVQAADPGGSGERVDGRDPALDDREAQHRDRAAVLRAEELGCATGSLSSGATSRAAPSTVAGWARRRWAKKRALPATARAPSTICSAPPPSSVRRTTSGCSIASRGSKTPHTDRARDQ